MSSAAALGQKWTYDEDLNKINFTFRGLEKHSRPNRLRHNLLLDNGPPGIEVKPILEAYFERTSDQRDDNSGLLIALIRPFGTLSTVTTRNIFIYSMGVANIDTSSFGPHSARASVTSAPGLSLKQILKLGCWRNASTFRKHYEAEILE